MSVPRGSAQSQGQLPDAKPLAFTSTPSLIDTVMPTAPERYGKYHLLERIGVGGMAEVWRAKTLGSEGFTKDLVIKRILPKITNDEESVRMFIDEARLVAKLHHPNIVQIFDFDKEGDRYYLAMELIEGRDLRQAEKAAAKAGVWFPIPLSIYLISETLKGLHYAYTRQDHGKPLEIVHRDVSPHNILISYSGDVKISDFGIAKVAERASSATSGTVKGKLAYMSPEQITGQPLDGRTDVYSMGIVFWELLTRHRLFFGPDEHDVIRRVRDGIVPSPRQYNPDIPEEVERIVMKMLVANRAQRYQSAGEVARQLCALPQYAYEAQALGEFMRTLFPEQTRNWTQMLQNMLNAPSTKSGESEQAQPAIELPPLPVDPKVAPEPAPPASPPPPSLRQPSAYATVVAPSGVLPPLPPTPPPRPAAAAPPAEAPSVSNTAAPPGAIASRSASPIEIESAPAQKPSAPRSTMAGSDQKTQIATEVPQAVANALAAQQQGGAPPGAAAGARTMIASAPPIVANLPPGGAPQAGSAAAGARTMIATAPSIPSPQGAAPGGAINQAATVYTIPAPNIPSASPMGGAAPRPGAAPLPLRPASALFAGGGQSAGMPPTTKWIIGPAIAVVVAIFTTFIANRIWPPETGSGGGGPSFLAAKRVVRVESDPPKAEVQVDGIALEDKTPTEIKGEIGKSARVRVVLSGYDPYEVTIAFTPDPRPPLKVKLFKVGSRQKAVDNTLYDERPDVAPGDDDKKPAQKDAKADKGKDTDDKKDPSDDKTEKDAKDTKAEKANAKAEKRADGEGEDEETPKKSHHKKGEGEPKKTATKATLTVLVRPWAMVYVDGKKLQQTPLRNHPISPGNHKILLVNDTKGKREEIKVKVSAGEALPEIKRSWE